MEKLTSCDYCARSHPLNKLTPLFEYNKEHVRYYCDRCLPEVKSNIQSLPWQHLYTWGKK